jgi:glycosyltransferase involved in cell wall biosynthesis
MACKRIILQNFDNYEICISDDLSNDLKEDRLLEYLKSSGSTYVYKKTECNLKFDGNLRNAITLSRGEYLILMGNDDGLSDPAALRAIYDEVMRYRAIDVAITNYRELPSGRIYRRITKTGVLGAGPATAVSNFRNYSFVSGIVLKGDRARQAATEAVDGSEMYQMYLGTRMIATGGRLLGIDRVCVDKDLEIAGQTVDSYRTLPRLHPCPIIERPLPMVRLLQVVAAGLGPDDPAKNRERNLIHAAEQLYRFTYPFWAIEYRVSQSWRFAVGVYLAVRPTRTADRLIFSREGKLRLWSMYIAFGLLALTIPVPLFRACKPWLYTLAKRARFR